MNNDDWLEWRRKGIGSSDAPVIMGVSPWTTPHKLWLDKTGRNREDISNWATRRGTSMEPIARAHYELLTDSDMPARCFVHHQAPWLRASLDGFNGQVVLEIKCPGKPDHALAMDGKIPDKYFPQVQHQLLVSGAEYADYFSFDGESGVIVRVDHDDDFQRRYLERAYEFWHLVETDTPPPLVDRDWKLIRSKPFTHLLKVWEASGRGEFATREIMKWAECGRIRNGPYYIDPFSKTITKVEGAAKPIVRRRKTSQ